MNFFFEILFPYCKLTRLSLLLAEYWSLHLPIFDALGNEINFSKMQEIPFVTCFFSPDIKSFIHSMKAILKQSSNMVRIIKHALENDYYCTALTFSNISFFSKEGRKKIENCN